MPLIAISADIVADSSVGADLLPVPQADDGYGLGSYGLSHYGSVFRTPLGTADLTANSSVAANATILYAAQLAALANSSVSADLHTPVHVDASLVADSSVSATAVKHTSDSAALVADSSVGGFLSGGTPVVIQRHGYFGIGDYGIGPYGGAATPFQVESAVSLGLTSVRLEFTDLLDFTFGPTLAPSNYVISPPLVVLAVIQESAKSLVLLTTAQSNITYTVTATVGRSLFDTLLDQFHNQATFLGSQQSPTFFGVATTPTRVRAVFQQPMLLDANLTDPSNYTLEDVRGFPITVFSVTPEQPTNPSSVLLSLATPLVTQNFYELTLSTTIHTTLGSPVDPPTSVFQWVSTPNQTTVSVGAFSGEVQNGLYGIHNGLVFFSPALVTSAANSIIQVDEIDVCTKAFDEYHFPLEVDPLPFFTFGGTISPAPQSLLNSAASLWVNFPRLFEAKLELGFHPSDVMPQAVDGPVSATFQEPWAIDRVALLNNASWRLFDNTGLTVPPTFITADNLTPIPPGPTSILILYAPMAGESSFQGTPHALWQGTAQVTADSALNATPRPEVPVIGGPSGAATVTARAGVKYQSAVSMQTDSFVSATLTKFP